MRTASVTPTDGKKKPEKNLLHFHGSSKGIVMRSTGMARQ
jgi:hypothetical protein